MTEKENQAGKRHQKRVNEEVSDGGGCIEAWNATNANRNESTSGSTRRAVIKILSTSAASAAGLGALGGQAAAEGSDTDYKSETGFTEITGPRANKLAARAKRSDEFKI